MAPPKGFEIQTREKAVQILKLLIINEILDSQQNSSTVTMHLFEKIIKFLGWLIAGSSVTVRPEFDSNISNELSSTWVEKIQVFNSLEIFNGLKR